jgi:hypothetical protein
VLRLHASKQNSTASGTTLLNSPISTFNESTRLPPACCSQISMIPWVMDISCMVGFPLQAVRVDPQRRI